MVNQLYEHVEGENTHRAPSAHFCRTARCRISEGTAVSSDLVIIDITVSILELQNCCHGRKIATLIMQFN